MHQRYAVANIVAHETVSMPSHPYLGLGFAHKSEAAGKQLCQLGWPSSAVAALRYALCVLVHMRSPGMMLTA